MGLFGKKSAEDWFDKGAALYDLQRYEEANEAYDQALRID